MLWFSYYLSWIVSLHPVTTQNPKKKSYMYIYCFHLLSRFSPLYNKVFIWYLYYSHILCKLITYIYISQFYSYFLYSWLSIFALTIFLLLNSITVIDAKNASNMQQNSNFVKRHQKFPSFYFLCFTFMIVTTNVNFFCAILPKACAVLVLADDSESCILHTQQFSRAIWRDAIDRKCFIWN